MCVNYLSFDLITFHFIMHYCSLLSLCFFSQSLSLSPHLTSPHLTSPHLLPRSSQTVHNVPLSYFFFIIFHIFVAVHFSFRLASATIFFGFSFAVPIFRCTFFGPRPHRNEAHVYFSRSLGLFQLMAFKLSQFHCGTQAMMPRR